MAPSGAFFFFQAMQRMHSCTAALGVVGANKITMFLPARRKSRPLADEKDDDDELCV
jgi:hypothetical protein